MSGRIAKTYLSLAAFYAADPVRRRSRERDIGLFWRSRRGPSVRAAWIQDTRELYLFQHALGSRGGGSVHLFAGRFDDEDLQERLAGWQDHCGAPASLDWLLARTAPDGQGPAPVHRRPAPAAA